MQKEDLKKGLKSRFSNISNSQISLVLDELEEKGIDFQKIDFNSIDSEANFDVLKAFLNEEYGISILTMKEIQQHGDDEWLKYRMAVKEENILSYESLNKIRTIAIYGGTGTGKSALAYKILALFKGHKTIYFLKHPNKRIIEQLGYKNLPNIEEIERLQDAVIYIDEPQIILPIYSNNNNSIIAKLCSLARQLNITLIISSSDTRVFTKHNESYFDLWLIKDLDYYMVKNGSKIKEAVKEHCLFEPKGFRLEINEFLAESRLLSGFNGKHTFTLPSFWTENHSKPYYSKIPNETENDLNNEMKNEMKK